MNILKNNVTPKSRKICSFCDFIVTNILVTPMIISTYYVTLNYIRKPVLLSQIDQWASPIPKALICALIAKIRSFHYMILFTTPRLLITSSSWTNRTCSIPALYPLYIRLVSALYQVVFKTINSSFRSCGTLNRVKRVRLTIEDSFL